MYNASANSLGCFNDDFYFPGNIPPTFIDNYNLFYVIVDYCESHGLTIVDKIQLKIIMRHLIKEYGYVFLINDQTSYVIASIFQYFGNCDYMFQVLNL